MRQSFFDDPAYQQVLEVYRSAFAPGFGQATDILELAVCPATGRCVVAASILTGLSGYPQSALFDCHLQKATLRRLAPKMIAARSPCFSPAGDQIAFRADTGGTGVFQAYLLGSDGEPVLLPQVAGTVEHLEWSPRGDRILLVVAGLGADTAGKDGAMTTARVGDELPAWLPDVETGDEAHRWRALWIIDLRSSQALEIRTPGLNIWEATWCGPGLVGALVSDRPDEAAWYAARAVVIDPSDGAHRDVYRPGAEVGWPAGSPDGRYLALSEGCCSDRGNVAGELVIVDLNTAHVRRIDTSGVAVTSLRWRNPDGLCFAGQRAFEVHFGEYSPTTGVVHTRWISEAPSCGYWHPFAVPGAGTDLYTVTESFATPPTVTRVTNGQPIPILELRHDGTRWASARVGDIAQRRWVAPDGLEIHGWLLQPRTRPPYPTVMEIHGGPVWAWRNVWIGRPYTALMLMLLDAGYAVFLPNPRGSTYRGQSYASRVRGDMGGADTWDYLSGLDSLIADGMTDPKRIGVTGSSYGGFMSAWLITQDSRFAAAIPRHGIGNWVSFHFTSNVPHFDRDFLAGDPLDPHGRHVTRSPIQYANRVRTPTMQIAGALDRITPASQSLEFHRALREHGVSSVLVTYPEEGHALRSMHGTLDARARMLSWLNRHMPA